jgi:hypothetical protein
VDFIIPQTGDDLLNNPSWFLGIRLETRIGTRFGHWMFIATYEGFVTRNEHFLDSDLSVISTRSDPVSFVHAWWGHVTRQPGTLAG